MSKQLSRDEVQRLLGTSPEEAEKELRQFSQAAQVFSSNQPRLIDEHPDQWVGVFDGEVAASSGDFTQLMHQLVEKGYPPERTLVRFITREEMTLLL